VNGEHLKEFSRELTALLHLRHPNLVLFMGAVFNPQLAIVTEFCSGDTLFRLLHQEKQVQLSWKQKLKMCRDVAHGMTYLHESEPPILHRDLKSLNLLLTDKVASATDGITVKITDFGVSKFLDESVNMMNTGQMGTCHWMAPEVLAGYHYSLPADVYSYGIVIWEIVCRETPYRGLNPTLIPYRVLNCNERPSMELLPASCPEALRTLMIGCWQTDPALRPTFPQILDTLEGIAMTNQMDNLLI
jgi:serine/threonine protein kinase